MALLRLPQPSLLPALEPGAVPTSVDALCPDPEALADAWAVLPAIPELDPVLRALGAPTLDLRVTPASLRAGLLAARIGRGFVHHELRLRMPMPPGLEPEVAVWAQGTLPSWSDGVLAEPKYFSFFLDDPHSPYNPNHRRKWRSHELLHGVVGWFWHPEMTRFQAYLGGRLDELLPVVHWYGLDELYRPRCPAHTASSGIPRLGTVPPKELCPACEALDRPFDQVDRDALRPAAAAWAARAREHLAAEWAACLAELETGRVHASPRPGVDGSSDAAGYLRGHWNRLTAWSFGAWVERFCVPGVDHSDTVEGMAARVARTCRDLTDGELAVDPAEQERLSDRRLLQDAGYRVLLAVEHAPAGGRAEQALLPRLDQLAEAAEALRRGEPVDAAGALSELLDAVDACAADLPDDLAARIPGLGSRRLLRERCVDAGLDQLMAGLASALPQACGGDEGAVPLAELEDLAWHFASSPAFDGPGTLGRRFAAWLQAEGRPDADAVAVEALVGDLPRRDGEAELFATVPPGDTAAERAAALAGWNLRPNRTLRRAWVLAEAVGVSGEEAARTDDQGRVEIAVAWLSGEAELAVLDDALAAVLDAAASGSVAGHDPELVDGLLVAGLLVAWPPPHRPAPSAQ